MPKKESNKTCEYCGNIFTVPKNSPKQLYCNNLCFRAFIESRKITSVCKWCDESWKHNAPARLFCSSSHAAKYNNLRREKNSREKQRETLLVTIQKKNIEKVKSPKIKSPKIKKKKRKLLTEKKPRIRKNKKEIFGPYSKIFHCICKFDGHLFMSKTIKKYCKTHENLYSRNGKAMYKFAFNMFDYPDLFDLSLLEKYGWYSVGGKSKRPINKTGCSRDHKVSVNDAIRNNYDPYYIKHPLNCELMLHISNKKKHSKSSISYEELVKIVTDYDSSLITDSQNRPLTHDSIL